MSRWEPGPEEEILDERDLLDEEDDGRMWWGDHEDDFDYVERS